METENISVKRAILHTLDTVGRDGLQLSSDCLEVTTELQNFIRKHVEHIVKSDTAHKCHFPDRTSDIWKWTAGISADRFVEYTSDAARKLYEYMEPIEEIPPADLLFALMAESGLEYLAILKLDYKRGYTHFIKKDEAGGMVRFRVNPRLLPSPSTRLTDAAVIPLGSDTADVIEKPRKVNGSLVRYFSSVFLETEPEKSNIEQISAVTKAISAITDMNAGEDSPVRKLAARSAINAVLNDTGKFDIGQIASAVFDAQDSRSINDFSERIEAAGLDMESTIDIQEDGLFRRFSVHKIKARNGVVIQIPDEVFTEEGLFEASSAPDGTVTVTLKGLEIMDV